MQTWVTETFDILFLKRVPEIFRVRCLLLLLGTIPMLKIFFFSKMSGTQELCLLRELLPRCHQFCFILYTGATEQDLNSVWFCAFLLDPLHFHCVEVCFVIHVG